MEGNAGGIEQHGRIGVGPVVAVAGVAVLAGYRAEARGVEGVAGIVEAVPDATDTARKRSIDRGRGFDTTTGAGP